MEGIGNILLQNNKVIICFQTPPKYQMTPESQRYSDFQNDYLEQENPIYNEFQPPENASPRDEQGFVMSPAVYV